MKLLSAIKSRVLTSQEMAGGTLMVDFYPEESYLAFYMRGKLHYLRLIPFGINSFQAEDEVVDTPASSEEVSEKQNLSENPTPFRQFLSLIMDHLESVGYLPSLDHILLMGDFGEIPQMADFFVQETRLSVRYSFGNVE